VSDVRAILVKSLAGGSLVVAFAVLSETLSPKRFAGSFPAAPSVGIAGLEHHRRPGSRSSSRRWRGSSSRSGSTGSRGRAARS
jgi:hypothetical protein